jgi:hypothetical protein
MCCVSRSSGCSGIIHDLVIFDFKGKGSYRVNVTNDFIAEATQEAKQSRERAIKVFRANIRAITGKRINGQDEDDAKGEQGDEKEDEYGEGDDEENREDDYEEDGEYDEEENGEYDEEENGEDGGEKIGEENGEKNGMDGEEDDDAEGEEDDMAEEERHPQEDRAPKRKQKRGQLYRELLAIATSENQRVTRGLKRRRC